MLAAPVEEPDCGHRQLVGFCSAGDCPPWHNTYHGLQEWWRLPRPGRALITALWGEDTAQLSCFQTPFGLWSLYGFEFHAFHVSTLCAYV